MTLFKSALSAITLFFILTGTSLAGSYHYNNCGDDNSQCANPVAYSESFIANNIDTQTHWSLLTGKYNTSEWSFSSLTAPGLKISSAILEVKNNAFGSFSFDNLYSGSSTFPYFTYVGSLNGGIDVFSLSSSLFDELLAGLSFKAIFSSKYEFVDWAKLTVEGEYCPPVSEVPVPAAAFLFAPALLGFMGLRRKSKQAV